MILPPPNVTGRLHLGHALTITVEDAIMRWERMRGHHDPVLWIPGLDHAGIATQVVVEKSLARNNQTRHDLGRKDFLEQVWKWKEMYGGFIDTQIKRTGASLAWGNSFFTMDEERSDAVTEAFVRLYESGLISRKTKIVNWCVHLRTVISDIEVDHLSVSEEDAPLSLDLPGSNPIQVGMIHTFKYPWSEHLPTDQDDGILVATTRPETMFADVAVAVHPEDEVKRQYIGRSLCHPLTGSIIPVISDPILVKSDLGTGAVKVTPAHDAADHACGVRHSLPSPFAINLDGVMNPEICPSPYHGLNRSESRAQVLQSMKDKGLLVSSEPREMTVSICSRSGDLLEPMLLPQWFVDTRQMAQDARNAVDHGQLKIVPKRHEADWDRWLRSPQEWCVSRQLWWGHRIPAWRVKSDKNIDKEDVWFVARSVSEAARISGMKVDDLIQDEDVLDTWFSSALLPISALGWPHDFHVAPQQSPLKLMETGSDILFFWVARMVMLCSFLSGVLPFETVYLHPMVRDAKGRKMSKSLGNGIDPLHVIEGKPLEDLLKLEGELTLSESQKENARRLIKENFPHGIPQRGADSLRFSLISFMDQSLSINFDLKRTDASYRFCNKLWNAVRFVLEKADGPVVDFSRFHDQFTTMDRWILHSLYSATKTSDSCFHSFDLQGAASAARDFLLNSFCDVYLEHTKGVLYEKYPEEAGFHWDERKSVVRSILSFCLLDGLKLLHPFMPFITEYLAQYLGPSSPPLLESPFPSHHAYSQWHNPDVAEQVSLLTSIVRTARFLRASHSITTSLPLNFVLMTDHPVLRDVAFLEHKHLRFFTNAQSFTIVSNDEELSNHAPPLPIDHRGKLFMEFHQDFQNKHLQTQFEKLVSRKKKKLDRLGNLEKLTQGSNYSLKASPEVQATHKNKIADLKTEIHQLEETIAPLESRLI